MKPEMPDTRHAQGRAEQGRVELWTPWGVVRSTRAQDAARLPRKPQPGPWLPPATRKRDRKPHA